MKLYFALSKYAFLFFTLFLLLFKANGQWAQTDTMPVGPNLKIGKLKNGLTFYILPNKKPEKKVELRLIINAGSIQEDDDQQGLAHFAEHMAFNGTKNFKKNAIVSFLQSIGVEFGADLNAYTSFDETVYILPIPTEKAGNLEKGFQILKDWAHQVSYLDEDIENERSIILEESRSGKGSNDRIFRQLYPKLFSGSLYANRLPIGNDSLIKTFKPDAIRRFYKDWYRPNLMAVIVVGDIDTEKGEALIKKHFNHLVNPVPERPRLSPKIPAYPTSEAMVITDAEATQNIMFLQYSPVTDAPSTTLGDYKKDITKNIFSTLTGERLDEFTQKPNPPFLYANIGNESFVRGYKNFGATILSGTLSPKTALEVTMQEWERIKKFGFTQAELDRAKSNLITSLENAYNERDKTPSATLANELIRNFLNQEPIPGIANELAYHKNFLPEISLETINELVNASNTSGNYLLAITGAEKSAKNFPSTDSLMHIIASSGKQTDLKAYEEKVVVKKLLSEIPKKGKIIKTTSNALMGTKTWTLSNGVEVTIKKTHFKNDEIRLAGRRPGGLGNYGPADKNNAQYATTIVNAMGFGNFTPVDLQKTLAGKSASAFAFIGSQTDNFSAYSNIKDAETMFQLLYLNITAPRIDTSLYSSLLQRFKSQISFIRDNPQVAFQDTVNNTLYGKHPMAPEVIPTTETFDQLSMERAIAIYKERFSNMHGMHIAIVGNFDEATLKQLVETYIASLPSFPITFTYKDNGLRTIKGAKRLDFHVGKEEKSHIEIIHTGDIAYSENLAMQVDAVVEALNIRIAEELREKMQAIYSGGINGSLRKIPYQAYAIKISLPTGPEKVDNVLKAMNHEIDLLKLKGPSAKILVKVKQQWLEQHKIAIKENETWLGQILEQKFPGSSTDRFLNYEKYVNALTAKQIQLAAQRLFNYKNVLTAVLWPSSAKK